MDGGKTFKPAASIDGPLTDRPWLAIDCTQGKNRGRLFCCGSINKPILHTSSDQAKTFAAQVVWPSKPLAYHTGNPVVFTDGTLVLPYGVYEFSGDDPLVHPSVFVLVSGDGGRTLQRGAAVTRDWHFMDPFPFPQLAADTTSGKHRDRVYAVWTDRVAEGRGEPRIQFSYSKDKGRSWTEPQVLSEQAPAGEQDYASYLPAIAVNKDGVVAVSWYDRRGLPKGKHREFPPGWNVRLRASLDGGMTWQPSVRVNEKTGKAPYDQVRDTAGLAADAEGNFHPAWIDDRTGKRQMWTAAVKVETK